MVKSMKKNAHKRVTKSLWPIVQIITTLQPNYISIKQNVLNVPVCQEEWGCSFRDRRGTIREGHPSVNKHSCTLKGLRNQTGSEMTCFISERPAYVKMGVVWFLRVAGQKEEEEGREKDGAAWLGPQPEFQTRQRNQGAPAVHFKLSV